MSVCACVFSLKLQSSNERNMAGERDGVANVVEVAELSKKHEKTLLQHQPTKQKKNEIDLKNVWENE